MRLAVYHHVYAVRGWKKILGEHVHALVDSRLDRAADIRFGIVGPDHQPALVENYLRVRLKHEVVTQEPEGWEQVTLAALYAAAMTDDFDAVCYLHTKGVTEPNEWNTAWRRSMLRGVVTLWEHCVKMLDEVDAVGCHWLTPEQWPEQVATPFFGGNFWWARADYVRSLGPCANEHRHQAEAWIGLGSPSVADLAPGWPHWSTLLRP